MKNWKSTMAFFVFVGAYVYSLIKDKEVGIVEITGYVALYSALFMMLRSEMTTSIIEKIIDSIGSTRK